MATYSIEGNAHSLTMPGHVSREHMLDRIEASGFTCDVTDIGYGYVFQHEGQYILWIDDRPPPDTDAEPVTFVMSRYVHPMGKAEGAQREVPLKLAQPPASREASPTGGEPPPYCPWCMSPDLRRMTRGQVAARFQIVGDDLDAQLQLGTHYLCRACGGVTVI
jgi:hypothetical protein